MKTAVPMDYNVNNRYDKKKQTVEELFKKKKWGDNGIKLNN